MDFIKNNSAHEIFNFLSECKQVVMTLHPSPDGDSLGGCAALKYVLERDYGCKVTLVSKDAISHHFIHYDFLNEVQFGIDISDLDLESYDALICIDCGEVGHISKKLRENFFIPKTVKIINIDHHISNNYYGFFNYIDSESPSACSVLFDLFKEARVSFDKKLALRLLVGICTDTHFFTNQIGIKKALEQSLYLLNFDIDYTKEIVRPLLYHQPLKIHQLRAQLINNIKLHPAMKIASSHISYKDIRRLKLTESDMSDIIDEICAIEGYDVFFLLVELKNYVKGSLRAMTRLNVSLFAQELGGGGNRYAAGFILPNLSLKKAEQKVLATIKKVGFHKV